MTAAYPASLLNWTQRINSQTVYAADPNTLAAEIDAIEQFVGVNPHIESSARTGATKTFASLSARVSDAMLQNGHPIVEVYRNTPFNIWHSKSSGGLGGVAFDKTARSWPNYISTGGKITIKDAGIWHIHCHMVWDYATTGWVQTALMDGGSILDRDVFDYSMFPRSGSNTYGERFINQYGHTDVSFFGSIGAGSVISISAGNYTNRNPLPIENTQLTAYFVRP